MFLIENLTVKRNNLIFYGIPNEPREKEHALIGKVTFLQFYDRWSKIGDRWLVIEDAEIDGFGLDERLQDLGKVKMTVMGIIFVLLNQSFW